ncbi:b-lymphocyte antigen-related [Holotrichia oblita]|uniref:B-lymphocyte antigen-related n=1 Tax=Holotrichia oblita TaxID=644536 RepID=A0ACB9SZK7_HOLOL|nr:b-lymphocyte antigen-related [Holotrichia oblita]
MEKLRSLITPDEYSVLKVSKNTIELIRFHAEIEDKSKLERVINKLDNKLIKLKDFHDLFKIRASEARLDFPNKHTWDSFFREAKDMNEMKSGERPDTIHISNLPIRWFVPYHLSGEEDLKPSEKIFYRIFEKFGRIRHVDIPICDPYRNKMKSQLSGLQTFSFDEKDFFEGYVQFKDYGGFVKAMDAFRGMKLLHKDIDFNETYMVNIKVDFDKTKHMSEGSIRRREIVRERLIRKQKEKEEKELIAKEEVRKIQEAERLGCFFIFRVKLLLYSIRFEFATSRQKELDQKKEKEKRRREREEHRKAKILAQLKIKDADEINDKIAKEEKKLLNAQRKLEAIRLIEELFRRVKVTKNKQEVRGDPERNFLANDELSRYKRSSEKEFHSRQNNLHHSIAGRVVLKTILSKKVKLRRDSSSSDSSVSQEKIDNGNKSVKPEGPPKEYPLMYPQYPQIQNPVYPYFTPVGLPIREQTYFPYHPKNRGFYKGAGPSREEVEEVTTKISEATTKTFTITHQNYKRNITDTSKNFSKNTTTEIRVVTADQGADQDQIIEDRDHDGDPTVDREDHVRVAALEGHIPAADHVRGPGRSLDVRRARTVTGIDLEREVPNLAADRERRRNRDLVVELQYYKEQLKMNLIEAKITAMIALGLGSLAMGLLPLLLTRFSRNNHPLFLSTLLCFGAGVLLSTSMVHMLPEIRESLGNFVDYAELFFCGGFFILYFIDEMVHLFKTQQHERATQNENKPLIQNSRRRHSTGACNTYGTTGDETQLLNQPSYNPNYQSRDDVSTAAVASTSYSDLHTHNITSHNPSQLCHIGHHAPCRTTNTSSLSLIVALTVHAILEGLAVGLEDSTSQVLLMLAAIASHKLVVGFCFGAELSSSNTTTPCQYFTAIILFSFGSVLGIVIGLSITDLNERLPILLIPVLQAFAGGTLLYITVSEVLPRERAQWHQIHEKKTAGIFQFIAVGIGFTVMSILINILHD